MALIPFLMVLGASARGAAWNGIEPFKSTRADVEHVLGAPIAGEGNGNSLRFKVAGGTVAITFVDAGFVARHKLASSLEGTVLEIALQHDSALDTPESLGISGKSEFKRQDQGAISIFRNVKEGIYYSFHNGKLATTYYNASEEQWQRAQRKG